MQTLRSTTVAALAALALSASCGESSASGPGQVLRFTAIPDANTTELTAKYAALADYLAGELGIEVQYVPTIDYQASVEAFKNGDVQLAWFGGLTGAQAREAVAGARAIAQGKVDPVYKSYFIANAASGLSPSEEFPMDLEGKKFCFGSESSTSGRLMPEYFIREHTGKAPGEFFAEIHFSGDHDKTASLVADGTYDAGALSYKKYDELVADGKLDAAQCFVIWTTPEYADYNWTAHPGLDTTLGAGFVERVQEALVGMKDPACLKALMREEGLIAASNQDFESLRELAAELGFLRASK